MVNACAKVLYELLWSPKDAWRMDYFYRESFELYDLYLWTVFSGILYIQSPAFCDLDCSFDELRRPR